MQLPWPLSNTVLMNLSFPISLSELQSSIMRLRIVRTPVTPDTREVVVWRFQGQPLLHSKIFVSNKQTNFMSIFKILNCCVFVYTMCVGVGGCVMCACRHVHTTVHMWRSEGNF